MAKSYVYKWTHKPTLSWYVGSHSGKIKNYICSSKIVKPLIKLNPQDWERTIIATGEYLNMYELETTILEMFDAKNDIRSYNRHNNDGKPTMFGRSHTDETRAKMSKSMKGSKNNPVSPNKGKKASEETRKKQSLAKIGFIPWNKGLTTPDNVRAKQRDSAKCKPPITEQTRKKLKDAAVAQWIKQKEKLNG